ncbi:MULTISPECIES: hypothetical protein [unclassified Imperialibacter]|uniref:hypothetical protein n=1 Tax=unclassified Imperialibacter TaxID=2629706 RepID=UPI00125782D7|nr:MULTISPECIES: hypothetical protein [unclassified Imperialibacter]CAD5270849.1 exported hypothetical protein [Imperialibacter sp. 89]CAD5298461.1 exported hypothetical protein [Imperialibacter sp. 75]VVT34923.1 exported hypothetical protein [Imperialibacter sp. EC-SDR9]
MRNKVFSILILVTTAFIMARCGNDIESPAKSTWDKTFGGVGDDFGIDIKTTSVGEIIILGQSQNLASDSSFARVIKLSADGNILFDRTIKTRKFSVPNGLMLNATDEIIVFGKTYDIEGESNSYILNLSSSDGSINWEKVHDLGIGDEITGMIGSENGKYLAVGNLKNEDDGFSGVGLQMSVVIEFSSAGDLLGSGHYIGLYGPGMISKGISIDKNDNYLVLAATYPSVVEYENDAYRGFSCFYMPKDHFGQIYFAYTLDFEIENITNSTGSYVQKMDGSDVAFLMASGTSAGGAKSQTILHELNLSSSDDPMNASFIDIFAKDLLLTAEGNFILVGDQPSTRDLVVKKVGPGLVEEWSKVFGGKNRDTGSGIIQIGDYYYILGSTESEGAGLNDIWILKIDASGNL